MSRPQIQRLYIDPRIRREDGPLYRSARVKAAWAGEDEYHRLREEGQPIPPEVRRMAVFSRFMEGVSMTECAAYFGVSLAEVEEDIRSYPIR